MASVPENTLKFGVGILLTSFGSFWVREGIGLTWPGAAWAILGLIVLFLVVASTLVLASRRLHHRRTERAPVARLRDAGTPSLITIGTVLRELWGLFVDDAWLAVGILVLVATTWTMQAGALTSAEWIGCFFAGGLSVVPALCTSRRVMA